MQTLHRKNAMMYRGESHSANMRKARTKTLIQAGGLLEKAGLLECVQLEAGQDLQKDPATFESVALLMGALLSLTEIFTAEDAEAQKMLWTVRGKQALAKRNILR
jgi:hypothetical protein